MICQLNSLYFTSALFIARTPFPENVEVYFFIWHLKNKASVLLPIYIDRFLENARTFENSRVKQMFEWVYLSVGFVPRVKVEWVSYHCLTPNQQSCTYWRWVKVEYSYTTTWTCMVKYIVFGCHVKKKRYFSWPKSYTFLYLPASQKINPQPGCS